MARQGWIGGAGVALALAAGLFCSAAQAAQAGLGLITIVDGAATVWRDAQRFPAAEGLRVRADDVVASSDATRLVRIEFDDGKTIDLGPATQAMLQPVALARDEERAAHLYLAQGWAKVSAPWFAAKPANVASPRLDVQRVSGNTLLFAGKGDDSWLHVETGVASVLPHGGGRRAAPYAVNEGQVFTLRGPMAGDVAERLNREQRAKLPRSFLDSLPRRGERFGVPVEPARGEPVAYADAAPWINGEAALRAGFVGRLSSRTKDPAFRHAVLAEMRLHPEWQRLFPPPAPRVATPQTLPIMPPAEADEVHAIAP